MKWGKGKYYHDSDSGYRISIVRVKGKLIYELWNPRREFIGMYDTPEQAREAANERTDRANHI